MASVSERNYSSFRKMYEEAKREKKETFVFEGQEVLVSYAKYLVEYLDGRKRA